MNKKKWVIVGISTLFLLLFLFLISHFCVPQITLKEGKEVKINLNDPYKEPKFKATYQGKDITKEVKKYGKVNVKKKGTYRITYVVKKGLFKTSVIQNIIVKDLENPIIELEGEKTLFLCKNKPYKEPGFKAKDNIDGDITDKVQVKQEKDKVIYTVKDKENNEAKETRELVYEDKEAPQIILTGGEVITQYFQESYQELGYQALDNCDGDITDKVVITGNIDSTQMGKQELTYTVKDSEGNETVVKRTVNIVERGKNGTIYLTFDDGPKEGTTDVILDILKEEGVKATFFVTSGGPDYLIKREADEGHTVALHTSSHDYATVYSSVDNYFSDLQAVHDRVMRITGQDARMIRFPGGSSNTISRRYSPGIMSILTKEVLTRGYRYYDWNLSSGDAGETRQKEGVYQNVINNLSKRRVNMILMHDIKPYTRDALRDIIRYGKNNGYTFEAITEQTDMITQRVNN